MPDMRYLDDEEKFLEYAFDVFGEYFSDEQEFHHFYDAIQSDKDKNRFLKLAGFYKFLVKDGFYVRPTPPHYVDYLDNTYKFIGIISLIEALYTENKYVDFHRWLMSKPRNEIFPIEEAQQLEELYQSYKAEYGVTQKVTQFFLSLDSASQRRLQEALRVWDEEPQPVKALAKLLYRMRSEFVHDACLIPELGETPIYSIRGGKLTVFGLSISDMKILFERGMLQHFGYDFD